MSMCVCMYAYVCIHFHTKTTTGREKEEKKKSVKQIVGIRNVNSNDDDGQINTVPNRPYTPIDRH